MQVYLLTPQGVTDVRRIDGAFRNFQDIKPSLAISYSSFTDVQIFMTPKSSGGPEIAIQYRDGGTLKTDEFKVHRLPVWDSPTHI
jgi:hypothetical protein